MRNLSRALALAAALILTGLTAQASAATLGNCYVRCSGAPSSSYYIHATYADCCLGDVPNYCPAGSEPVPYFWNSSRCVV